MECAQPVLHAVWAHAIEDLRDPDVAGDREQLRQCHHAVVRACVVQGLALIDERTVLAVERVRSSHGAVVQCAGQRDRFQRGARHERAANRDVTRGAPRTTGARADLTVARIEHEDCG